jgi:hypothetical protein
MARADSDRGTPIGPDLMRRAIAWKRQVRVHGGLPPSARKVIEAAVTQLEQGGRVEPTALRLKPGTRLVRRWQRKTYHVLVLEDGVEHGGRRYASLSQIARAITGAHWSGPRSSACGRAPRMTTMAERKRCAVYTRK